MWPKIETGFYHCWEESNDVERFLFFILLTFSPVVRILTWYGVKFEEFSEESVGSLMLIEAYGLEFALFLNTLVIVLFLTLLWMTWVHYRIERQKQNPSELLHKGSFLILTWVFMIFFWITMLNFMNDASVIMFGWSGLLELINYKYPAILASIWTVIYVGLGQED